MIRIRFIEGDQFRQTASDAWPSPEAPKLKVNPAAFVIGQLHVRFHIASCRDLPRWRWFAADLGNHIRLHVDSAEIVLRPVGRESDLLLHGLDIAAVTSKFV